MNATSPSSAPRIIALISAYNEGDVIHHVIGDLIANGLQVYLIDNASADDTIAQATPWLGKGLLKIERFPEEAGPGYSERCTKEYVWKEILRRKEELAAQLGADWYIHADADEFRESPWPGMSLGEAIAKVDRMGYNAINFELLNFRPTDDGFQPGTDVRKHLVGFEAGEIFDSQQIKAWKNPGVPVEIARNGGHNIQFPGRRVFPLNFILRHYPIRGETHGRRKVYKDRLPRFAAEEVAHNWHVQYNEFVHGKAEFLHKPEKLEVYDANAVRARLLSRFSDDVILTTSLSGNGSFVGNLSTPAITAWLKTKLGMQKTPPPEIIGQADQAINRLLPSQEQGLKRIEVQLDKQTRSLLLALLEVKISLARLSGESHLACLAQRLLVVLRD